MCIWRQFRGLYRCIVIVLVDIRTPKHSSDQCRSILFLILVTDSLIRSSDVVDVASVLKSLEGAC